MEYLDLQCDLCDEYKRIPAIIHGYKGTYCCECGFSEYLNQMEVDRQESNKKTKETLGYEDKIKKVDDWETVIDRVFN